MGRRKPNITRLGRMIRGELTTADRLAILREAVEFALDGGFGGHINAIDPVSLLEALDDIKGDDEPCRCREHMARWCVLHGICHCRDRTTVVEGHPGWFRYEDPDPEAELDCPIHRPQQELFR